MELFLDVQVVIQSFFMIHSPHNDVIHRRWGGTYVVHTGYSLTSDAVDGARVKKAEIEAGRPFRHFITTCVCRKRAT